jgi:hypothetical protein
MRANILIGIISLALLVGCRATRSVAPDFDQEDPTPAPPWVTNSEAPAPVEITVAYGESKTLDTPASVDRLVIRAGARVEAPSLEVVTRMVSVHHGAVLIAPRLGSCGVLEIGAGAKVDAPQLWKANQVVAQDDATIAAPLLRECFGVRVGDGVTFDAPCASRAERR